MSKLASIESVRARLGFDEIDTIDQIIESCVKGATTSLIPLLRSSFARRTGFDTFYVNSKEFDGRRTSRLKLSQGWVDSGEDLAVVSASARADLSDPDLVTDISDYATWDYTRGVINIDDYDLCKAWVRVTYTAGFELDPSDGEQFDLATVPEELQEAARLQAMVTAYSSPTLRRTDQFNQYELEELKRRFDQHCAQLVRYEPSAQNPA